MFLVGQKITVFFFPIKFKKVKSQKGKVKNYFLLFSLALIIMVARMFINSFISFKRGSNLFSGIRLVAISKRSQYLVSLASLRAISNLWIKSAVLWAALDSSTFARGCLLRKPQKLVRPVSMEVPERINCLDNSLAVTCVSFKKRQRLTMRTENSKVLSQISNGFSVISLFKQFAFPSYLLTFAF